MTDAVVVGSGPNGLAAAVTLAQAGVSVTVVESADRIGGGARSAELTLPGLLHDECSAFHPTGVASPFLRSLDLQQYGLEWAWPPIDLAHPLEGGSAGALSRTMAMTVELVGTDGAAAATIRAVGAGFDSLAEEIMRPLPHLPRHRWRWQALGRGRCCRRRLSPGGGEPRRRRRSSQAWPPTRCTRYAGRSRPRLGWC
jgi:phytoene dehydrogenase-like protein